MRIQKAKEEKVEMTIEKLAKSRNGIERDLDNDVGTERKWKN